MLSWVHLGDLHASDEDGWESLSRLKALVMDANRHLTQRADFAFLPGDNANHGEAEQYRRIRTVLDDLELDWFAIPGDHDFEPKSLGHFYDGLGVHPLPHSAIIKGRRCLFVDIVSQGSGGPDFRLGEKQTDWLKRELEHSRTDRERPAVFMHAFPGDLHEGANAIATLFADYGVASVDSGHTHYNELLNDGGVIYTATRSTGQIEEGPVGFSLHALDGTVVSWRFKPLEQPWPFVLITSPSDHRLVTDPSKADQAPTGAFSVRAKVFGENVNQVRLTLGEAAPIAMRKVKGEVGVWTGEIAAPGSGLHYIQVTAIAASGAEDSDKITVMVTPPGAAASRALKTSPGDHVHSIGVWPEHGLLATQLGPNKNDTIKW